MVRLDLLRHLAISSVNMAVAGPAVATFDVPDGDIRVLWGPVGTKEAAEVGLEALPTGEVLGRLEAGGGYVVYNPAGIRHRLAVVADQLPRPAEETPERRRQTA